MPGDALFAVLGALGICLGSCVQRHKVDALLAHLHLRPAGAVCHQRVGIAAQALHIGQREARGDYLGIVVAVLSYIYI